MTVSAQTTDQINILRKVGVPVILPSYLPSGFRQINFEADIKKSQFASYDASYEAIYKGANKCNFRISVCNHCGWGDDINIIREWVINSRLLGKITLMQLAQELQVWIFGDKSREGEVFKRFPQTNFLFIFSCQRDLSLLSSLEEANTTIESKLFSPQEAIKIIQSLRFAKK